MFFNLPPASPKNLGQAIVNFITTFLFTGLMMWLILAGLLEWAWNIVLVNHFHLIAPIGYRVSLGIIIGTFVFGTMLSNVFGFLKRG